MAATIRFIVLLMIIGLSYLENKKKWLSYTNKEQIKLNIYNIANLISDPDWHLIFGGLTIESDPSGYPTDSVELYNWKNGEQCQLPNLNYLIHSQVSVVLNGTPAFCGGQSNQEMIQCWMLDKVTKAWMQVSCIIFYCIVAQVWKFASIFSKFEFFFQMKFLTIQKKEKKKGAYIWLLNKTLFLYF